jgi:galactokinase
VVSARAPGRVNLLGEHTDYNEGFVLPVAIPQATTVHARLADGYAVRSANLEKSSTFTLDQPPGERFALYSYGCIRELTRRGIRVPPVELTVESDVPMGVGLSSSAALEVATLRALRSLLAFEMDDVEIARLAQQAEIRYAGVHCGIMDQMACSLARTDKALFLDTRTLERRMVALPADAQTLVVDSGVPRSLAHSGYNARRAECDEAARRLGVSALRDVHDEMALDALPAPLAKRVRHVTSENQRVLRAVEGVSADVFGQLMSASHVSLRDDFEVSTPELDALVDALEAEAGVYGARLTGAGFGGACVALCRAGAAREAGTRALARYNGAGRQGRVVVPPAR